MEIFLYCEPKLLRLTLIQILIIVTGDPFSKGCIAPAGIIRMDCLADRVPLTNQIHLFLCTGNACVQDVPLQHHIKGSHPGDDDNITLGSLGLVYGNGNLVIPIISSVLAGIFVVIIMIVAGVGAAAQIAGYGGLGIAALFSILLYTLLIAAVIALGAAQMVLTVLINKQILERFTSGNMATVHAVLTIAVPLYQAFCFFVMRNREFNPGMEPKITPPPTPITPITPGGPGAAVPPPSVQVTPVTPEKPAEPAAPAGPLPKEDEGRAETSVSEPSAVRSQSTDETDKTE